MCTWVTDTVVLPRDGAGALEVTVQIHLEKRAVADRAGVAVMVGDFFLTQVAKWITKVS